MIDLARYTTAGVGILAGRDRGERARKEEQLDSLDRDPNATAIVVIPEEIYSVNSSFFLGMFDESVQVLGAEQFRKKYQFRGPAAERTRDEGIRKAMLLGKPFRPPRARAHR